jgi:hypothetical protein
MSDEVFDDYDDDYDLEEYEDFEDGSFKQNTCFTDFDRAGITPSDKKGVQYVDMNGRVKNLPVFVSIRREKYTKNKNDSLIDKSFNVVIPKLTPGNSNRGKVYPSEEVVSSVLEKCVEDLTPPDKREQLRDWNFKKRIRDLERLNDENGIPKNIKVLYDNYKQYFVPENATNKVMIDNSKAYISDGIEGVAGMFVALDFNNRVLLNEILHRPVIPYVLFKARVDNSDLEGFYLLIDAMFEFKDPNTDEPCEPWISGCKNEIFMFKKSNNLKVEEKSKK